MAQTRHAVLTLTGTGNVLSLASAFGTDAAKIGMCKQLILQAFGSNAAPIYIGATADTLTTTNYGFRIEAATATVPPAPTILEEINLGLANLSAIGANTEKLSILAITN